MPQAATLRTSGCNPRYIRLQPYVPQARFLESACTKIDHANSCVYCQATLTLTLTLTPTLTLTLARTLTLTLTPTLTLTLTLVQAVRAAGAV